MDFDNRLDLLEVLCTNLRSTAVEHYVPATERIATFDNDGTLWCRG